MLPIGSLIGDPPNLYTNRMRAMRSGTINSRMTMARLAFGSKLANGSKAKIDFRIALSNGAGSLLFLRPP